MPRHQWMALVVSGLVAGCAARPERYGFDSATSACRQNPAVCARMAGEEAVLPGTRAMRVAASIGTAGDAALRLMKAEERDAIEEALEACADDARSTVLIALFNGRNPTPEECRSEVTVDAQGRPITLAMQLGTEMHKVALPCAHKWLSELRPGGFRLEPRYRYNPDSGRWEPMREEDVRALLRHGRGSELKGTLVPDVVIHTGSEMQVLAIYDFKFPCVTPTRPSNWPRYPKGHPHEGQQQDAMYQRALKPKQAPLQVTPRMGTLP
ncbi:hypothetical protein [Myxococcus sp. NMCA1]|uniref:hypothetical protein n=1 Tax=Myxococcus sp. NMCA1 TaxID=2996785 RepID=UPI002285B7DA|nr:hypothetical protein [Myxococcus sp. NMCA1]WAM25384.1 hypothetical protein OZ403_33455 [Myxococcus sp. NMCA1]